MEKDKLEQFINENRDELDDKAPSEGVWKNIRFRMGFTKDKYPFNWWKVAAVVFFALSTILIADRFNSISEVSTPMISSNSFDQVEDYYFNVIDEKKTLISDLSEAVVLGDETERDLHRLNAMYEVIKEEFDCNPTKKLEDALILNLIVRIDILNDELQLADDGLDPKISI